MKHSALLVIENALIGIAGVLLAAMYLLILLGYLFA